MPKPFGGPRRGSKRARSAVDAGVRQHTRRAAIWAGRGLFKGTALVAAFALIVAVWFWNAAVLTETADYNLWIIKRVTETLPGDWSSRSRAHCAFSAPTARCC